MHELLVRDAMQPAPEPLLATMPLDDMVRRFTRRDVSALPVVDVDGCYCGLVTADEVDAALASDPVGVTAGDIANLAGTVAPDAPLDAVLSRFVQQGTSALPVMEPGGSSLVGWLTHRDILVTYQTRLEIRPAAPPYTEPVPVQPKTPQQARL